MAVVVQEHTGCQPEAAKRCVCHMFSMGNLLMRIPTIETAARLAAALCELGVDARVIDFETECEAHC